ncbi:uncharacterized protein B0H18DRAFT_1215472 [Fomitopsis serialis]|uniref:uncharacterized protein n=1 Tax=Fomitopsis serialis TaxID=139415 RepID=UPI002007C6A4|nr:uncharacterized protein B0H18DRAFT_1215472 [Neoantrodia serialis]KAH9915523.1 hypothetical protein B0H18DRAFT_1215472 [Neoantrodia serialis]
MLHRAHLCYFSSIRILRLREDVSGGHKVQEYGYRMRRHAFKQLLPTVLCDLSELKELELRSLGHEAFWHPLKSVPGGCFLSCNIHTLHISETHRALVETLHDPQLINDWCMSSIRPFMKLRRLGLDGWATDVANLVNAIVAPELEDIELTCSPDPGDVRLEVDALSVTFDILRRRNVTSMRILRVIFCELESQHINDLACY